MIQAGSIPFESSEAGAAAAPPLGVMLEIWNSLLLRPPPPSVPLAEEKFNVAGPVPALFCCTREPILKIAEEPAP